MALASYASTSDLGTYLDGADATANATIWTTLLANASRLIDRECRRFFYIESAGTEKWFSVPNDNQTLLLTYRDFFTVTQLRILKAENNSISDATQYDILAGDGVTPPSNFYLLPENPELAGSTSSPTATKPYWGIQLPTVPTSTTSPPSIFVKGFRTVGITASWGWPAVPDVVKNITLKLAARAWQSKSTGWTDSTGSPDIGVKSNFSLDPEDWYLLKRSDLIADYPY